MGWPARRLRHLEEGREPRRLLVLLVRLLACPLRRRQVHVQAIQWEGLAGTRGCGLEVGQLLPDEDESQVAAFGRFQQERVVTLPPRRHEAGGHDVSVKGRLDGDQRILRVRFDMDSRMEVLLLAQRKEAAFASLVEKEVLQRRLALRSRAERVVHQRRASSETPTMLERMYSKCM